MDHRTATRAGMPTAVVIALAMLAAAGCGPEPASQPARHSPSAGDIAAMSEPNITQVAPIFDPFNPWIYNEDRSEIRGLVIGALYLLGPRSKGAFGDGIIRPRLYVAQRLPDGSRKWRPVKEWSFTPEQAMPFRAKRETAFGWGYRLYLRWDDIQEDLHGQEIRLIVSFERRDGVTVGSDAKDIRVPNKGR